ncbi:hypothetical protein CRE_25608 [Caenorhabditis remanei]|uniref:Tyrosine-protein phosphatase domain-containing protein n=1 Tax=Caenorhabditis remanei TaxID=31234 RepID=E3LSK8_CAERE|nr:hypothetical protein CRE_25608 [Caenorhabditis remanei]
MNKSTRSRRKKKVKNLDRSERKTAKTGGLGKSERKKKAKKKDQSERGNRKKKLDITGTTGGSTGGSTGSGPEIGIAIDGEGCNKLERRAKEKEKEKEKEQWSGENMAKKMVASGAFDAAAIADIFKRLPNDKPSLSNCTSFKTNIQKVRAPDCPIPDEKLIKLTHAPGNFICAAKVTVPEFSRTMIVTQVPDVSVPTNIEDFWRMIFQEEIHSVVIAIMPLECSVTLQQIFPLLNGTYSNHGKMFLNNKKVESTVAMTAYTLEILPDGCSNSLFTTVYHIHNWKQKRGLDNVGDLVTTLEKVIKTNEVSFENEDPPHNLILQNTVLMSMNGTGRAGTMLALFNSMLFVNKGKEVNTKEIVEKLRAERCGLIDNAEQYGTVYRAMAFWFKSKSADEEIQKKINEFAPCVQ